MNNSDTASDFWTAFSVRHFQDWRISDSTLFIQRWANADITIYITKQSRGDLGDANLKQTPLKTVNKLVLLQTCLLQHGSEGLVTLTSTKPGSVQRSGFTSGHFLGLQVTDLLAFSQIHSSQLYSKTSSNCHKKTRGFS